MDGGGNMLVAGSVSSLDDDEFPLSSSLSVPSEFSDSAKSDPIPELELESDASDASDGKDESQRARLDVAVVVVVVVVGIGVDVDLVGDMSFASTGSASPASSVLVTRP